MLSSQDAFFRSFRRKIRDRQWNINKFNMRATLIVAASCTRTYQRTCDNDAKKKERKKWMDMIRLFWTRQIYTRTSFQMNGMDSGHTHAHTILFRYGSRNRAALHSNARGKRNKHRLFHQIDSAHNIEETVVSLEHQCYFSRSIARVSFSICTFRFLRVSVKVRRRLPRDRWQMSIRRFHAWCAR